MYSKFPKYIHAYCLFDKNKKKFNIDLQNTLMQLMLLILKSYLQVK